MAYESSWVINAKDILKEEYQYYYLTVSLKSNQVLNIPLGYLVWKYTQ